MKARVIRKLLGKRILSHRPMIENATMSFRQRWSVLVMALLLMPVPGIVPGMTAGVASAVTTVDMSASLVRVNVDFHGEDILIFGAVNRGDDVIVRILGPDRQLRVRRYRERYGLWFLDPDEWSFKKIPSFYYLASNRVLSHLGTERYWLDKAAVSAMPTKGGEELLSEPLSHSIATTTSTPWSDTNWRQLRASLIADNLWQVKDNAVTIKDGVLFKTLFHLPFKAVAGIYRIDVFSIPKKADMPPSRQRLLLTVERVGIGRTIHTLSLDHGTIYGILAVLMALAMGGGAALFSRRLHQ